MARQACPAYERAGQSERPNVPAVASPQIGLTTARYPGKLDKVDRRVIEDLIQTNQPFWIGLG